MKNIVIGTAGHVDHGKSSLIRALTGTETDRLREERERGMSIELGFASFDLPGGGRAGIVDVPGHERFIKNMLMGATGMDLVLLVVAADEGVMPQTREHLNILRLLDIRTGVIALTKADLVDEEWVELVAEDVRDLVKGSFLENAPIIPVSSTTRAGLPELVAALDAVAARTSERIGVGPFRMPVDRVFTMAGFGTVVTGTLRAGIVRVGETADLLPRGLQARIRGVQVHGQKVDSARAGSRVALNLVGVELDDAARGSVVAAAGALQPTSMVDVRLDLLHELERPLLHRSRIRFHTGAVEIMGRIALLDRTEAAPGESVVAQIRLEEVTAVGQGDRFVLRRYSPGVLLGGGSILDAHPRRHRRSAAGVVEALLVRERGSPAEKVSQALLAAGPTAMAVEDLAAATAVARGDLPGVLETLSQEGLAVAVGNRWAHAHQQADLERRVQELLAQFHGNSPLQPGMPREDLRSRTGRAVDSRLYNLAITRLEADGAVAQEGGLVRLAAFEPRLEGAAAEVAERLLAAFRSAALNPPSMEEAAGLAGGGAMVRSVFDLLVYRGELVKIAEGLFLSREAFEGARDTTIRLLQESGSVTVSQLRDALGSSRKIMVPFLEHLDAIRVTRRRGDERVLW